jgi:hypothetical protein
MGNFLVTNLRSVWRVWETYCIHDPQDWYAPTRLHGVITPKLRLRKNYCCWFEDRWMFVHAEFRKVEEALESWKSYVTRGMMHVPPYLSASPLDFHFPDQSISLIVSPPVLIITSIEGTCDVWLLLSPASQLLGPQPALGERYWW